MKNQVYTCPSCQLSTIAKSNETKLLFCSNCAELVESTVDFSRSPSSVPADWSFIQIGTTGKIDTKTFTVIGRVRLQLRNDYKNFWTILYNDNTLGWMMESFGSFAIMEPTQFQFPRDNADKLKPDARITIGKERAFIVEYLEKCDQLSFEGEVGDWLTFSDDFFVVQASSVLSEVIFFTIDPSGKTLYLLGKKIEIEHLYLQNTIVWDEWK